MGRRSWLLVVLALLAGVPSSVRAQTEPAASSSLGPLCTDRPTKSTSPCTVDAGHVQIEADLANFTYDRQDGETTTTWIAPNPTVKLGLTRDLDAELNIAPYVSVLFRDRASGARSRLSGVGDLFLRLKWGVFASGGGAVTVAVSPYVKLPTARNGIGNGAVEGGVIVPVNLNLAKDWSLVIDPEVDLVRNAADNCRHLDASGLLSLSRNLSRTLTLSAELWTSTDFDPTGARTQASGDLGLAYIPASSPNWQLDGGVNFGLNRQTPTTQAYVGLSHRF